MSATNRSGKRREDDSYPTPDWCVHRLLEAFCFDVSIECKWLEPCAGDGNLVRAVNTVHDRIQWDATEIRAECTDNLKRYLNRFYIRDFLAKTTKISSKFHVAIMNPPFRLALDFAKKCIKHSDDTVMLQRLGFLGSAKRHPFFSSNMPDVYVLPDRPCFTGDGKTDAEVYAWFHWGCANNKVGRIEVLNTTPLEERRVSL